MSLDIEFVIQRTHDDKGITVRIQTGDEPTAGYVVARENSGYRIPEDKFFSPAGIGTVSEFAARHFDTDGWLGTWWEAGNVDLEISDVILDLDEACKAGTERNQDAIWDVVAKENIDPRTRRRWK